MQITNSKSNYIREILWRSYYVFSVSFLIYIFLSYLITAVTPTTLFIDRQIFSPNYIRIVLGLAFFLAMSGWNILKSLNSINFQSPWTLNRMEKIITISSAILLAYIFGGSLQIPSVLAFIAFIAFLIGFIYLIPQLLNFYSHFTINDLAYFHKFIFHLITALASSLKRIHSIKKESNNKKYSIVITKEQINLLKLMGTSSLIIIFISVIIIVTISKYVTGQTIRENKLRKLFYITSIAPEHTTPGRTAKLIGYNFGFKTDTNYQVLTDDGIVLEIVTWDKDFIEFLIPLSLPMGNHKIWIVRPTDELHREQGYKKSNKISLEVHSRFALLPDVDDSKFDRGVKKIKKLLIDTYPQFSPLIFSVYKYE